MATAQTGRPSAPRPCPPGLTRLPVLAPRPPGLLLRQLPLPPLGLGRLLLPVLVLLRGRRGAGDPGPPSPAADGQGPREPAGPLGPAHLQGTGEEVPEGLHGAERVLQGQLLGVLAQVVGQLQPLLLDGLEQPLQGPAGLQAGLWEPGAAGHCPESPRRALPAVLAATGRQPRLGPRAAPRRRGDSHWHGPADSGPRAGPSSCLSPPHAHCPVGAWQTREGQSGVRHCEEPPALARPLTCRRPVYCSCTSAQEDDTFRSISRSLFRLLLASERRISRLTLQSRVGAGDSCGRGVGGPLPCPPARRWPGAGGALGLARRRGVRRCPMWVPGLQSLDWSSFCGNRLGRAALPGRVTPWVRPVPGPQAPGDGGAQPCSRQPSVPSPPRETQAGPATFLAGTRGGALARVGGPGQGAPTLLPGRAAPGPGAAAAGPGGSSPPPATARVQGDCCGRPLRLLPTPAPGS